MKVCSFLSTWCDIQQTEVDVETPNLTVRKYELKRAFYGMYQEELARIKSGR